MLRVRLKADGRIVEILPDGSEKTLDHNDPASFVRQVRSRCGLTQAAFAEKIEVPIETVRNWEQGKRSSARAGARAAQADRQRSGCRFCGVRWQTTLIAYSAAAETRARGAGRASRISRNIKNSVAI